METVKTVIIKERIQRNGYVLVLTHEVPKSEEYRDCRLIRDTTIFQTLPYHPIVDWESYERELREKVRLGRLPHYDRDGYCDNPARGY